jgi:hypothetical protein
MALWTPAQIDTALWLDAADSSTLVGSPVTTWNDKSGSLRHATASSAVTIDDTTFIHNALSFNGAQRFTVPHAEALSAVGGLTVIGVVKYNATTNNRGWIGKWQSGALDWYHLRSSAGMFAFGVQVGGGQTVASHTPDTNPHILGGLATPGDALINTKDGAHVSVALGTPSGTASGPLSIGAYSGTGGVDFVGLIGELIICSNAVSLTDFRNLEGYLAHKWGLAANLPADHPYKNAAPQSLAFTGTVRDTTGALAARTVTALRESDQTVVGTTTSDAVTGEYEIITSHDEAHTLIFSGEADRNAIVYSGVMPS